METKIETGTYNDSQIQVLEGLEAVADNVLHGALKFGVTCKAKLNGKAHHGGFGHVDGSAQLRGGHVRAFFVVIDDVRRDLTLPFGKGGHFPLHTFQ